MSVVAVLLVAAGAWLWSGPDAAPRIRRLASTPRHGSVGRRAVLDLRRLAALAAAAAALLLVGGLPGVVAAVACVLLLPRLLGRLESRSTRDRRARMLAQAPLVADLLSATTAAGAPMRPALAVVATAVGDPVAGAIRPVLAALDLGSDPVAAWAPLRHDAALGAIAQAVARSTESGAPLSSDLARIAEDLRREHQTAVEVAARSAGVRAVLPLVACFLPAFLLLGVVPVVAALAGGLMGW